MNANSILRFTNPVAECIFEVLFKNIELCFHLKGDFAAYSVIFSLNVINFAFNFKNFGNQLQNCPQILQMPSYF